METTAVDESQGPESVLAALHRIRADLAPLASQLSSDEHALGLVEPALPLLRTIQRLTDGLLTRIVNASQDASSTPIDTLLTAGGTIPRTQARAETERARVAGSFPAVAAAIESGVAHTANIDVLARLTRSMSPADLVVLGDHHAALADAAGRLSEESFRKRVSRLRDKIRRDGGNTAAVQVENDSFARVAPNAARDAYRLQGGFDPVRGAAIKAAIAREVAHLTDDPESSRGMDGAQLSAQALHDLVLRGDSVDRTEVARASVRVHVLCDRDTLVSGPHDDTIAETLDGLPIGAGTLGRLCCEATMRRVETAPDGHVSVSRTSRSPSEAQRIALRALYPVCPISGVGWESIEIHHTIFFGTSRRTVPSELVPISRRWHHLIHDAGWTLAMDSDRTLHLSRPDGTLERVIAPPVPINQADHELAA